MREEAAQMRLHLWLERLKQLHMWVNLDTALEHALDAVLSVGSADCANIQLVHPRWRGLELKAQRGFGQPFLHFFEFVNDVNTACGVALKEHRPVFVEDVASSPIFLHTRTLEVMLDAQIRAVRSTPLIDDIGRLLGVCSVHYFQPRIDRQTDLSRFVALGKGIAQLISATRPAQMRRLIRRRREPAPGASVL